MTTTWVQLRSAAMLGLARRPLTDIDIDGVRPAADADPGERFLTAAALAGAQRRAGARPATAPEPPAPAPAESLPLAPTTAIQLLGLVLGGALGRDAASRPLLVHWLRTASSSGAIVPPTLLVTLLDRAVASPELQPDIAAVLGERGRWLAAQREDWWAALRGTAADADPALDETDQLPKAARLARLEDARRSDPGVTRAWIEARWDDAKAADRALFLAALAVEASPADEQLLDRALDDRSVAVREAAALVLDRLPTSRRADRLAAALVPLIDRPGRLRRKLAVAALPDGVDLARDLPGKAVGATLLRNLLLGAPLQVWTEATGLAPSDLLRHQTDPADLVDLWVRAAIAQRDERWLWALISADPAPKLVGQAVAVAPGPWSADQSQAAVTALRRHKHPAILLDSNSEALVERVHESAVDQLEAWRSKLGADEKTVDRHLRQILQHLSTRRSITEAFS